MCVHCRIFGGLFEKFTADESAEQHLEQFRGICPLRLSRADWRPRKVDKQTAESFMQPNGNNELTSHAELRSSGVDKAEMVVPLFVEEAGLSKRWVETSRVRVSTTTKQEEQVLDEVLKQENVEVERRAVGRPIDSVPGMREEGDTIIVPVVEEVLVVERRLVLKEEIHIRRVRSTKRHQERIVVRKQEAAIERIPAGTFHSGAGPVLDAQTQQTDNRVEVKKES